MVQAEQFSAQIKIPALYFLAGDTVGNGPLVRDVFRSEVTRIRVVTVTCG